MRAFIVLCLVAAACADKLGYNYQPVGHSDAGLSFSPGAGGIGGGGVVGIGGIGGVGGIGGGGIGGGGIGGGGIGDGGIGGIGGIGGGGVGGIGGIGGIGDGGISGIGGIGDGGFGGVSGVGAPSSGFDNLSPSYQAPVAEFNKEFFSYSAPEHEFDDAQGAQQVANSIKKNLRVVFIKGPENKGLENAVLNLAKHASDDKTAIYVLNKQADIGDLANKLNAVRSQNNNKPEVHFVKYRTPQDAANAQQVIQSQYDQLGGSSQSHNGGVAPVINFASQAPVHAPVAHAPGSAYLPSSIFRRRV